MKGWRENRGGAGVGKDREGRGGGRCVRACVFNAKRERL